MRNKTIDIIKDMQKSLRMLKESNIFDDDMYSEENLPVKTNDMPVPTGQKGSEDDGRSIEDAEYTEVHDFIDAVKQIRNTARDNFKYYGDDINSQEYIFLKKIYDMCDKMMVNAQGKGNQETDEN